jgi:fumarate hydratase subunit alpha
MSVKPTAHAVREEATMREITSKAITKAVAELAIKANCILPDDVYGCFKKALEAEPSSVGKDVLGQLMENADIARKETMPICQDTGLAVVFVELGQEVHISGGDFEAAIHEGVRRGYVDGYLRKSAVAEPLFERKNTKDNTPAIIHIRIVPGDALRLRLAPKGAGSENKGVLKMLVPADGIEGMKKVVIEAVKAAGPNSCPPMVVGVGIGGNMEIACLCAKRACARDIESKNSDPRYAALEEELLGLVNKTGIGPAGLGGKTTAIKVNVEWYPTHIACLPVAVNINCNAARHAEVIL